jgi:asparagine synthase (glutamine-hydrolysing)
LNPIDQPVKDSKGLCMILFHGELYNMSGSLNDPEYVLKKYNEEGNRCASDLNGIFHFIIYDTRSNTIKLFTDKFGLQPLYYSHTPDGFFFGGEIKAILSVPSVSRKPDYKTFGDFFHFGHPLGQKTLFENIKQLGPGEILTFDMNRNRILAEKYWRLGDLFSENGHYDPSITVENVAEHLIHSIQSRSGNHDALGISLSGGLDSRGILAGLKDQAKGIRSYTLGLQGCSDQGLAKRISSVAGTRHEFLTLDDRYIENFEEMAAQMIYLSDGLYHPRESTEILALEYFKRCDFKILLRGHGGEIAKAALAHPVMVNQKVMSCSSSPEILDAIYHMANLVRRDIDFRQLFTQNYREVMEKGPEDSLNESCGEISQRITPADVCIYYYINEHIRRQVVSSLEIFKTQIETRMPYVDDAYIRQLLKLPVQYRFDGQIHFALIKKCMPQLIKIPNSNTGAPLDAGKMRLLITDKFHSIMKRLSIKGFRHYTEFNKWHREGFKNSIQKIIFSERTAGRGLYNMDYLKHLYNLHLSGQKNYGAFIGTVVGLEIWQRLFSDNNQKLF